VWRHVEKRKIQSYLPSFQSLITDNATSKRIKNNIAFRDFMSSANFPVNRRIIGYVLLAVGLGILVIPYVFFPQFYIPKADASMGYVAPASIEGWVFMGVGIALLLVGIFFAKFSPRD